MRQPHPLAIYNPVTETQFYGDGQHNGGVYFWGNLNPYIYTYQNPIKYIDPNGKQTEGYQSAEAQSLSEIVTIRGQKYHKNTTNLPAKVGNTINSWFGGDSDYFVEKKPYNKVEDKFVHELVDNAAGELVGLKILKYGGKFLLKPLLCFAEGTMISTSTGLKPIESIKEGDLVWSYNETNKESELKKVISPRWRELLARALQII
ncbi:hypothetical protein [Chryseobacterium sp.]|uniref:hypothetical protein n=1 Tax=Chryseobacterium sp. TaxID=1871047 RepID=UPI00321AD0D4